MLASLDNGVIFKKAFTNKLVFTSFVKDILGIDVEVAVIETEKQFNPKEGNIDFKLDIFAETIDKRIVIEIQRIEYDYNFDRFLHYFFAVIMEQQKSAKRYKIEQTVYVIVLMTEPYQINDKTGEAVRDEVLLLEINPQNILSEKRDIYGHQFVCLNPNYQDNFTPNHIRDWLQLIYQSIHNPSNPVLNTQNIGIKKVIELIEYDNLTPQEVAEMKNMESGRVKNLLDRAKTIKETKEEVAVNCINEGLSDAQSSKISGLSIERIEQIRETL